MDIGIFLPTGTRGYLISETAPRNEPTYALNRDVTLAAERYGCEFALSMVKFRGFEGPSDYWRAALEPFTLISALAAQTSRIKLFSTAASLVMPPAVVARMAATVDQVAPGRFGINVVTGWQKAEYEQMGAWPGEVHYDRRYDVLGEYVQVMQDLWRTGRCDLDGQWFQMRDCRMEPTPERIELVVAGGSEAGVRFAARYADYNFCSAPDTINAPEGAEGPIRRLQAACAETGRRVKALLWLTVIAAETDEAAMARWEHYKAGTDFQALGISKAQAQADARGAADPHSTATRVGQRKEPSPTSSMKLIGSYATVARLLDQVADIPGLDGVMLSFDDFREGIEAFGERVQPQMASRAARLQAAN